jgi:hypothetical protein
MSTDYLVMQAWCIDRKPIERRFPKHNFQTGVHSSFCYKGHRNSIVHEIRKRIILTFTSFSITHSACRKNLLFTSTECLVMQQWGIDRMPINSRFKKMQFSDRCKFKFLQQEPWNSIEHMVRNSIILTFTSFSITQLEKPAFYLHGQVQWCTSKASTESLMIIDSKNTISDWPKFKSLLQEPWNSNKTESTKQHNINFNVFFDYTAEKTYFLCPQID